MNGSIVNIFFYCARLLFPPRGKSGSSYPVWSSTCTARETSTKFCWDSFLLLLGCYCCGGFFNTCMLVAHCVWASTLLTEKGGSVICSSKVGGKWGWVDGDWGWGWGCIYICWWRCCQFLTTPTWNHVGGFYKFSTIHNFHPSIIWAQILCQVFKISLHALFLSLTHTHSLSLSHTHCLSLSLSLSHTHAHTCNGKTD